MPNTFTLIQTLTAGAGGQSEFDFTSIPQTYTDLVLKFSLRITTGGYDSTPWVTGRLRFNGSTFPTSAKQLYGTGSATGSDTNLAPIFMEDTDGTASIFGNGEIYIPNYTSTVNKAISVDVIGENNATASLAVLWSGLNTLTSPITSITIFQDGYTIAQYSSASLYGIKNS
jgi:hypothetical protein